jgi:putative membrane protein
MQLASIRRLPLLLALAAISLSGLAQTGTGTGPAAGTGSTGSSTTLGTAPATQPGTGTRQDETNKDDNVVKADRRFMIEAGKSGMYEVEAARLATDKAQDPAVKSYASMLVAEHSKANEELVQLANSRKVELSLLSHGERRKLEKLADAKGRDFDRAFVREVGIQAHKQDIKLFDKGSRGARDPALKAWIDKTLPHLRQHLAEAEKLASAGKR